MTVIFDVAPCSVVEVYNTFIIGMTVEAASTPKRW